MMIIEKKAEDYQKAWDGLELISTGRAVMADWEWASGLGIEFLRPWLVSTGTNATSVPCPSDEPCCCRHDVRMTDRWGLVGTCRCSDACCDGFRLREGYALIYAMNLWELGRAVCRVLGMQVKTVGAFEFGEMREVGLCGPGIPVYLSCADTEALARELMKVISLREGPFLLLTPTGRSCSAGAEQILKREAAGHVSLSSVLDCLPGARLRAKPNATASIAEFVRRVEHRPGLRVLQEIKTEIAAVRTEQVELRTAKQRLEKMVADGVFTFTKKVDAGSFKILCTILAEGDVSKAARKLGMGDPLMRYTLRQWRDRGGAYTTMLDLVRWRKTVGRRQELPLNDAILNERAESTDYPGLLADVLEGLLSMTEQNWQELADELGSLIRPAVSGDR